MCDHVCYMNVVLADHGTNKSVFGAFCVSESCWKLSLLTTRVTATAIFRFLKNENFPNAKQKNCVDFWLRVTTCGQCDQFRDIGSEMLDHTVYSRTSAYMVDPGDFRQRITQAYSIAALFVLFSACRLLGWGPQGRCACHWKWPNDRPYVPQPQKKDCMHDLPSPPYGRAQEKTFLIILGRIKTAIEAM